MEVAKFIPQARTSEHIVEQIAGVSVPQIHEQIVEVAKIIPQARTSEHIVEQIAGVPVPQIHEQIVEVGKNIPQERIAERTAEQFANVPVPQILKEIVEVGKAVKNFPQERISERIYEQVDDVPVPQILNEIVEVARIDADFVPFDQPGDGPTVTTCCLCRGPVWSTTTQLLDLRLDALQQPGLAALHAFRAEFGPLRATGAAKQRLALPNQRHDP